MTDFAFQEGQLSEKQKFIFLFPPLPYSGASNLRDIYANFSGKIVTSSSVPDHRDRSGGGGGGWYTFLERSLHWASKNFKITSIGEKLFKQKPKI